jgi:hypothetical protein
MCVSKSDTTLLIHKKLNEKFEETYKLKNTRIKIKKKQKYIESEQKWKKK